MDIPSKSVGLRLSKKMDFWDPFGMVPVTVKKGIVKVIVV